MNGNLPAKVLATKLGLKTTEVKAFTDAYGKTVVRHPMPARAVSFEIERLATVLQGAPGEAKKQSAKASAPVFMTLCHSSREIMWHRRFVEVVWRIVEQGPVYMTSGRHLRFVLNCDSICTIVRGALLALLAISMSGCIILAFGFPRIWSGQSGTWVGHVRVETMYFHDGTPHEVAVVTIVQGTPVTKSKATGYPSSIHRDWVLVDAKGHTMPAVTYVNKTVRITGQIKCETATDPNFNRGVFKTPPDQFMAQNPTLFPHYTPLITNSGVVLVNHVFQANSFVVAARPKDIVILGGAPLP